MKGFLAIIGFSAALVASAQDTTTNNQKHQDALSFNFFVEAYYGYDFNKPTDNTRPFVYSHNRHNEFNINLAYLKGSYNYGRTRANLAVAAGTYMNANYAAEPGVLKNIYEANAGVKIAKNKDLWIDVGILPSHIGFESAHSPSCWTLTRSIIAESSPYYEAGAKITYTSDNEKMAFKCFGIKRLAKNSADEWKLFDELGCTISIQTNGQSHFELQQLSRYRSTWQFKANEVFS